MRRRRLALAAALVATLAGVAMLWSRQGSSARGASLLLITIDTLRADRLGAYGARSGATPVLDALAAQGTVFEQAHAAVPLTLPSHATLLSGLEPPHHGVRDNGLYVFPQERATLATHLRAHGYATAAFVGAFVLDRRFGLARGFDVYDDRIERDERRAGGLESERRAEVVVAAARAWLAAQHGPFFAWVHVYDPHAPYAAPPEWAARFPARPYEAEIAYVDAQLAGLIDVARGAAGGRLVTVVTADHGEGLGEHGERTHGFFLYEGTLRVPLIMAGAGLPRGVRKPGLARGCDLTPTLLSHLGLPVPDGLDGRDVLHGPPGREAYAETLYPRSLGFAPLYALRAGPMKLIQAPRPELYDLASDPAESHDLSADLARRAPLEGALARLLAGQTDVAAPGAPEVEERLRALGYVASGPAPSGSAPALDPKDGLVLWQRVEAAVAAEARGELPQARLELQAAVDAAPDNLALRRLLAGVLRRSRDEQGAARLLSDAAALSGRDAVAWHERALSLAALGQLEEARHCEERALALLPTLPEPRNHLGVLLARLGQPQAALAAFERTLELDPNNARAWNNRANTLRDLGRPGEAQAAYERALELAPRDPDPRNGLGVLAVQAGQLAAAERRFHEVLELDPSYDDARLNLAVVLVKQERLDEARELLDDLLRRKPEARLEARARGLRHALARAAP
jgi:arylsulfatase A-like enzyme/Flp pilus assembly protein TadD